MQKDTKQKKEYTVVGIFFAMLRWNKIWLIFLRDNGGVYLSHNDL